MKIYKNIKSRKVLNSKIDPNYIITPEKAAKFIDFVDLKNTEKEKNLQKLPKSDFSKHMPKNIVNFKYHEHFIAFKAINSPDIETLTKMLNQNISTKEIQKIIDQHLIECMELMTKIEKEGITDAHTTLILLLIDEVIKNLKIRRIIFTRIINKQTNTLLPQSPQLNDGLLTLATRDLVHISEKNLLPHFLHRLKHLTQDLMKLKI